jgi:hypothetical protein
LIFAAYLFHGSGFRGRLRTGVLLEDEDFGGSALLHARGFNVYACAHIELLTFALTEPFTGKIANCLPLLEREGVIPFFYYVWT